MTINCYEIDSILRLCKKFENEILDQSQGWSNVELVYLMKLPLLPALKMEILEGVSAIDYWEYPGSPHNEPNKGFICKKHKVAISFPS